MGVTKTRVVVIGAGQAGLAVAYYLQARRFRPGEDFVVLDRSSQPGGSWQFRWEGLRLGATHRVHDLPGMSGLGLSFLTADRSLPASRVVAEYYGRYEEAFALGVKRPRAVSRVVSFYSDLLVEGKDLARDREFRYLCETVVNATGTWGAGFIPHYPGRDKFLGRQLHSSQYRGAEEFRDRRVAVVGGGTSAASILLELESVADEVVWCTRRKPDFRREEDLAGPEAAVINRQQQDEAARAGEFLPSIVSGAGIVLTRKITSARRRGWLRDGPMFSRLTPTSLVWPDGREFVADDLIWATGFRPELRHLAGLKFREKTGGFQVDGGRSGQDCRLFLVGYGPAASTFGANRVARAVVEQILQQLG